MTPPVLAARGLGRRIRMPRGGTLELLHDIDLTVARGESLAIMGASGSGKSSLLAIFGLMATADTGSLEIEGVPVSRLSDRRRTRLRNRRIGFVFQSYSLVRHLNTTRNVELPLLYRGGMSGRERRARVRESLALVGLTDRAHSRPRHLSGGEQQRTAIARALVTQPALILADEPTGALDTRTAHDVLDALYGTTSARGCALVVVTHDREVAARADRVLILENGSLRLASRTAL